MKTKKVLTDPSLVKHLHGHKKGVTGLSFDPQSKHLVSSSQDHSLILWNLNDKMRAFKFLGHADVVSDACFSPNGQLIASVSFDRTFRLWTPTIGGNSTSCKVHTKAIQSVDFSYDGLTLLTASNDRSIKESSVTRRTYLSTYSGHTNWVKSAKFSHDARVVVSASDDKCVKLFDRQSHQCLHTFTESRIPQKAIFHPTDNYVAVALSNKCIKLYDLRVLKQLQLYECHEDDVKSIVFHPNGNYLFSSSQDGTAKIIDLLEGRTLYSLEGNRGPLTVVASAFSSEYFATGGLDGQILLWEANFDEVECEDNELENDEFIEEKQKVQLLDSGIIEKFNHIDLNSSEDKENIKQNSNDSIEGDNQKEKLNETVSCSEEDTMSLSKKMDAVLELMQKMRNQLESLDERCRKLEDLHFNITEKIL